MKYILKFTLIIFIVALSNNLFGQTNPSIQTKEGPDGVYTVSLLFAPDPSFTNVKINTTTINIYVPEDIAASSINGSWSKGDIGFIDHASLLDFCPNTPPNLGWLQYNSPNSLTIGNMVAGGEYPLFTISTNLLAPQNVFLAPCDALGPNGTSIAPDGGTFSGISPSATMTILPVELTSFKAEKKDEIHSLLTWETASEINNDLFEVQRSVNGKDFIAIGRVDGHGTTTEAQLYNFLDRAPEFGKNYYRLKQMDFNGKYEYSDIRMLAFEDERDFRIFPNPTADYINVTLEKEYDGIKIMNQLGQLVKTVPSTQLTQNQLKINVADFTPGMYYIEAQYGNDVINKQFIKID